MKDPDGRRWSRVRAVGLRPRETRQPLYVPVATDPPLRHCWSVNISTSGMGLVAARDAASDADALLPAEGDAITIDLRLPDTDARFVAATRVAWRHDAPEQVAWLPDVSEPEQSVAIGVTFASLAAAQRDSLTRYLEAYRFNVCVANADATTRALARNTLDAHCRLFFSRGRDELDAVLGRGDVAALVLCGEEAPALAILEQLFAHDGDGDDGEIPGGVTAAEFSPRPIYCAAVDSAETLMPLFNAERLFRALPQPLDGDALEESVLAACRDYGVRTERRRVALALERALSRAEARHRPPAALAQLAEERLIYRSRRMAEVLESARLVAPHRVPVLLEGETGTGKEILARLLHDWSERANASFVVQDCGTLSATLLESELFGHIKGAFTGAIADRPGLFSRADGGTIFLDEIENTSADFQAKLLRVIETGETRPVGGTRVRRVDVRVLAASNRDMRALVDDGRFRADLYYRLDAFPIRLPPLRERGGDILVLAEHFRAAANATLRKSVGGFSKETARLLGAYHWPGNVRELRNVVDRAVLLCRGEVVTPDLLPAHCAAPTRSAVELAPGGQSLRASLQEVERSLIAQALARCDGVLERAARVLDMHPVTLGRRAKRYGL